MPIKKLVFSTFLLGNLLILASFSPTALPDSKTIDSPLLEKGDSLQEKALFILQSKCNDCHGKKKKKAVFTLENMNGYAKKINKQVFIKKRMPKGNEVKLTAEEREWLRKWVGEQLAANS